MIVYKPLTTHVGLAVSCGAEKQNLYWLQGVCEIEAPNLSRKSSSHIAPKTNKSHLRRKSSTLRSSNFSFPPLSRKVCTLSSSKKKEGKQSY